MPVVTLRPHINQVSHPQNQNNAAGGRQRHKGQKPYDNAPMVGAFGDLQKSHYKHDKPFFEKPPTKELQQLIERDKYDHNSNRDSFKLNHLQSNKPADQSMSMFGKDGLNKHNSDNHFFPNSAKSSMSHNHELSFQGHSDYPDFELFNQTKQKQKAKGKRRFKKPPSVKKRNRANSRPLPTRRPQPQKLKTQEEIDPFLDLDYIEVSKY